MTEIFFNRDAIIDWWLWWLAIETTWLSFRNAFATDAALVHHAKIIGVAHPRHARVVCIIGGIAGVAWLGVAAFMSYEDRNVLLSSSGILPAIMVIGTLWLTHRSRPGRKPPH